METKKNIQIETLRGLAILLVVMGHVIGSAPDGGMKIDFPSPFRYLYLWIDYIQMPLFTAIAGWVYALKPFNGNFKNFATKKFRRILLPMIAVGTLYFLVQYFTPGTNNKSALYDIWRIYLFPYTLYWYLPTLFLIFLFIAWIDKHQWANTISKWGVIFTISCVLMAIEKTILPNEIPNLFSFKGAMAQLPYFITGLGIQRFSSSIISSNKNMLYGIITLIGIGLLQLEWFYPIKEFSLYSCLKPLLIIAGLFLLLQQKRSNQFLIWIGSYTYSIYLFHGFGTSGMRIILNKLGLDNEIIVFLSALIIAVACSIIADWILSKNRITRLLFLGKTR